MLREGSSPSYEELFGDLDFGEDDDARSVYSPAAYFVDLLGLLEGHFDRPALLERRADLRRVKLDFDNTFVEQSYLDIVNEVLERLIDTHPYDNLRKRHHPFGLPFWLTAEQISKYLQYLQVTPLELYRLFAPQPNHDVVAREYLGLSTDEVAVVTTPVLDEAALAQRYGVAALTELSDAERFAEATGLTGTQVRELVELGTTVTLDDKGTTLVWGATAPLAWLDRTNRFLRLVRMTGLTITDLATALTTYRPGELDAQALRALAIVLRLHRDHDLTVTDVCRLAVPIEDEEEVQGCSGDILAPRNDDYRFRLAGWIEVAEEDIRTIVRRYREHYAAKDPSPFDQGDVGLTEIGLLHRAGHLAGTLGITTDELFDVFVALDSDPALRRHTSFPVFGEAGQRDCFAILAGDAPTETLWLAQTLFAVVTWAQNAGFSGQELTEVLGGRPDADDTLTPLVDAIRSAFEPVAFDPTVFAGDRFGTRAATVVHDVLTAFDKGVVSPADDRLLRVDQEAAAAAAHTAITDLGVLVAEDFRGLGLGERLQGKIFGNLVLLGWLSPDGRLTDDAVEDLVLASDFEPYRTELFKLIGTFAETTGAFFVSDLADLNGMSTAQQAELYDNLLFHGYLDDAGDLTDPDFFLDTANEPGFTVDVDLADATEAVVDLLAERIRAVAEEPLELDPAIFADLRLTEAELAALTDSLTFNGHLDANRCYRDRATLSTLDVADFGLAPAFYPRRRVILAAMREQLTAFESALRTFTSDDFVDTADEVMSERVLAALADTYTDQGRVLDEALFADPAGEIDLGPDFSAAEQTTIFARIVAVLDDERPYRLARTDLADLGFNDDELETVVAQLVEIGYLTENLAVEREWLPYFRNLDNAFSFALPDLADFSTDIFFLLHAVAGELVAGGNDVLDLLLARAQEQRTALHQAFADVFGLPSDTAAAVVEAVTGGADEALAVLVAPVLDTENLPAQPHFRLACRRIRRFASLAAKLGLDPTEVTAVFRDQDLVGKFPENLVLPPGVRKFDALLEGHDGKILVFDGKDVWTYAAGTYALSSTTATKLADLSPRFEDLDGIDAAFTVPAGPEWLVGHTRDGVSRAFVRQPGGTRWAPQEQLWGTVRNDFTDPAKIDGAFADRDGRTYLFAGDQYIRYSTTDYTAVDEGYPRPVAEWREREGREVVVTGPAGPLDAFQAPDGTIHVLTGAAGWGRVRNAFDNLATLDAAYSGGAAVHLFAGGQVVRYSDSIENDGVRVDEGYPRNIHTAITDVPAQFESGVEAAFVDQTGVLHLFKDGRTASVGGTDTAITQTARRWGVLAPALPSGTIDAAFAGLDGKTYLFSGGTYLRYSTADYSAVDAGYPRAIDADWGGLSSVDVAFVLDGSTYLFGAGGLLFDLTDELRAHVTTGKVTPALRNRFAEHGFTPTTITASGTGANTQWTITTEQSHTLTVRVEGLRTKVFGDGTRCYVRYSTKDYRTPDAGFPKPLSDNWWNMPAGLEFGDVDAVLTGHDDQTYLFSGDQFLQFDARRRWWSRPMSLRERWDSLPVDPFDHVDAAFTGQDGRTYLFADDRYVRYSTADHTEVDDGYPAVIAGFWGTVRNNIERTGRVDAALVTEVTEKVDGVDVQRKYTYLFAGDQYVRYLEAGYDRVQLGYPRLLGSLRTEPGFEALDVELDGVDAAFADRRTAYLFRDGQCYAVSAVTNRRYDDLDLGGVTCAFMENGSIVTNAGQDWVKRSALEGRGGTVATPFRPRTLRTVPTEFRSGLDSVLTGVDGNTYLFKGATCFNTRLGRGYPLAEEWGRPRNTVYEQGRVDAAFVGRDGKTYLFSADQFVVYPGPGTTIDGDPKPIAEHWGGLDSVALAYVHGEQTHIYEHPDEEGMLRHLVYSGTDYTTPDEGYPEYVDDGVFGAPDGFPFPDAVLVQGDTLILLSYEDCVSHDTKTGTWSVVRPIRRLFPGFGDGLDAPDSLRAAFTARDGATYFFFDNTFARFADDVLGPLTPTRDRWGLSPNPFVSAEHGSVDAAFVWRQHTYLFSGDRYVRYTGPGYRAIDPGYPKKTAGNLRLEEPFANLPETFDDALDQPIEAVVGNDRTIHVIIGGVCHTVSPALAGVYTLDGVGRPRNTIVDTGVVDAALVADRRVYLLSGDQYVRYSTSDYSTVDDGYPRPLGELATELGVPALPPAFTEGVDAAFRSPDGRTYLFRGKEFVRGATPEAVNGTFGKVRNEFATGGPAAAFVAPTGELYAFRGDQYVRYSGGVPAEFVDQGFPRTVRDDWGDLPREFEEGPDGAFVFEGRTHLTKGERYVRYSGSYDRVDRTFPQEFTHRFASTSDYRLSDLHTIVRFVDLARSRPQGLAELFVTGAADPYQVLGELFGWDVEELRWARRNSDLLVESTHEEQVVEIEFVLALVDLFATAAKFGIGPSRIHADVWSKLHTDTAKDPVAAATALYAMLERRTGPAAWPALETRIHNELNVLRRDALVAALAPREGGSRELFEQYLIDVDMGPVGTTSRVREAIAATQLFIHRYLIDLETVTLPAGSDPDEVKSRIRTWWSWMKNYRIWEANRKVFLYPENYIRPELRDRKTPAFAALEDDLLQHEITAEAVQSAYKRYLDEYTEVSRLAIAGGYVYTEDGADDGVRRLVLFGRTRTEPHRYYYRGATFRDDETFSATWEPWETVDVQIAADRVSPVHAFGRVFVFWPVAEVVTPDSSTTRITTTPKDGGQEVTATPPVYQVKIYYSFYDLNHKWVPAQLLTVETTKAGPVTDLGLHVQASRDVPGVGAHDSIVVQSTYRAAGAEQIHAYTLTPELYPLAVKEFTRPAAHAATKLIFDEPDSTPIDQTKVVPFNAPVDSADGPWFSVDHKGGSFLCRPASGPTKAEPLVRSRDNQENLPTAWDRLEGAFELPDTTRTRYFFNNKTGKYVNVPATTSPTGKPGASTAADFGVIGTNMVRTGRVDAVLVRQNHIYLFSGDEYYRYPKQNFGQLEAGFPKKLLGNEDTLPEWSAVDGVFTDQNGREYFYSREKKGYAASGAFDTIIAAADQWSDLGSNRLDGLLTRAGRVYLLFGSRWIRLGNDFKPRQSGDLKGNGEGLPEASVPGPSFEYGNGVVTFDNQQGTWRIRPSDDTETRYIRDLGRVPTAITRTGVVNAAYLAEDGDQTRLFLVSGGEFVRYTLNADGTVPKYVDAGYPKNTGQPVDAVFVRNGQRYVFSGHGYGVLDNGKELDTRLSMRSVAGNWRCLPEGFLFQRTGVLETATTLFIFTSDGRVAYYAAYPAVEDIARPYEIATLPNQVIRLTSSIASELNRRLLVGGIDALLAPDTQELDELPAFSDSESGPTTIKVRSATDSAGVPVGSHLDFDSSNGLYYWEIFFHAPMLIAKALGDAQRFEDAKRWYEYVFDPTERRRYWRFLPFLQVDVEALTAGCRADLLVLGNDPIRTELTKVLDKLEPMAPAFLPTRVLTKTEADYLVGLTDPTSVAGGVLAGVRTGLGNLRDLVAPEAEARRSLLERVEMIKLLDRQYKLLTGDRKGLLDAYRDDPFDPHRIAALRPAAYRRTVVMAYIDNLLNWGDLLFRQYTGESIDEARMLYIFAYDLLGPRPYDTGPRALPAAATYDDLDGDSDTSAEAVAQLTANGALLEGSGAVHLGVANPYFYVPDNVVFLEYWTRVEDRLTKIRASLDIMGISRPVPLFEPPADVMALVEGVAKGASLDQITAALGTPVSAYRFGFLHRKAQELTDRLKQLGGDLLGAFERRDTEELSLLQNRQEAAILDLTRAIKESQIQIAEQGLAEARVSLSGAQGRVSYYEDLIKNGLSPMQIAQLTMMSTGAALHFVSGGLKIGAAVAAAFPETYYGPFIMGASYGGNELGDTLEIASDVTQTFAEGFSMLGEVLGIRADQERQEQDWHFQLATSRTDVEQLGHQVASAELQVAVARRELAVLEREAKNVEEVNTFLTGKFANAQLYGWMVQRLSGLYFQAYNLAYEMARAAEKAYQFEGGDNGTFIQPTYWASKQGGLLAADALALDLDRLGQAAVHGARRGLEITKQVSLAQLDPMALLALKNDGRCEFALTEELFDRDFPGHYQRQVRTVSVSFETHDGPTGVNATLTQLDNKTVLSADPKAVKFLLDPKGKPPESLRGDWRPSQQIALSDIEEGRDNNGLFELRYDDDRYLPFEGTGAVSRWRLAGRVPAALVDVVVTVKYTAEQGGETFATAVKGMLRPYPTARYFDVANEFPDDWAAFVDGDSDELHLYVTPDLLPGLTGRQVTGVLATYELTEQGAARFLVNGNDRMALDGGKLVRTPGLALGDLLLTFEGDKSVLANLGLILTYRASAR
jgi:Tc toxin complex TcA C-terminal TcB-binding domain/Neuraminidase-like domain/Hemopexin/Salmonella virulence plasmid 28.1kDa A protein